MRTGCGAALAAAAALLGVAAPAAGAEVSYPATPSRQDVAAWVRPATGLAPEQVVYADDGSLFAVISQSRQGASRNAQVRGEALTAEVAARTGAVSVRMHVDLDCAGGLVRAGATEGYASRDAQGPSVVLKLADPALRRPERAGPLEAVLGFVCRGARGPLAGAAAPPRAAAQVASSATEADARAFVDRLALHLSAPLSPRIEPAKVKGRTVYRVLVAGFASTEAAEAYCANARRTGQACFTR